MRTRATALSLALLAGAAQASAAPAKGTGLAEGTAKGTLSVNGKPHDSPWLPASFAEHGGKLEFTLGAQANKAWGSDIAKAPPSFPPPKA